MKRRIHFAILISIIIGMIDPLVSVSQQKKISPEAEAQAEERAAAALKDKNIARFLIILQDCVDRGSSLCAYDLGIYYRLKKDFPRAFDLFLKASLAGHLEAQIELSLLYLEGNGTEKDATCATFWIGTAAKSGYEPAIKLAQRQGIKYYGDGYGLTVENLIYYGYPWLEAARNDKTRNPVLAETDLNDRAKTAFRKGDLLRARYLLAQGVVAGYPSCMYDLGMMRYLSMKYTIAFGLFLQAALAGHGEAQYMLSSMYAEGKGVKEDVSKSKFWLGTSAKSGSEYAIKSCDKKRIDYMSDRYGLTDKNLRKHGYNR